MKDRSGIWAAIGHGIKTWTVGDVTVNGPEDQQQLEAMLEKFPDVREAFVRRISVNAEAEARADRMRDQIDRLLAQKDMRHESTEASSGGVTNPLRISVAIDRFKARMQASAENTDRTVRDKTRMLENLIAGIVEKNPSLGEDPWVHEIETNHLSAALDSVQVRKSGAPAPSDERIKVVAPRTVIKKISDIRSFFEFAHTELQATATNPTAGLDRRRKALKSAASRENQHYDPFSTEHLRRIFEPRSYLAHNRAADYFWGPLIGLHLGTRLKEIVTLRLDAIERHAETGVWYMDVTPEFAKNANSIRRLPITQPLLDLGFIEYVEHMLALGAEHLFAHRDWSCSTLRLDPSKNSSRHFGEYLDHLKIKDDALVFHSFRHTVVSALQDHNVPLADAMQVTGHQAQDHAVRTGRVTQREAASVHISTYTHSDKARLNVEYPLVRLKEHLERSIAPPLDYRMLAVAARIVRQHTTRGLDGIQSGWPTLRRAYTEEQIVKLDSA